ncbi:OLC1v1000864C1 [Oldenlandia corymbosa var. corymbosa]|uniref:OLC1v1000864C1 n=1 Tax=Oldenlandia corymbosa var. corymbosa TaxID=529605 RepID=A0AAV1D402_OLDCO|nr:OLC1v1000864C1 [Oldenlandia corymbosa var. corymbosa]
MECAIHFECRLKNYRICVDPAIDILKLVAFDNLSQYAPHLRGSIQQMFLDLQFYKMFFWGFGFPEELLAPDQMLCLSFMIQKFRRASEELKMQYEAATEEEKIVNWEPMSSRLKVLIRDHMPEAGEICRFLLQNGFKCKFSFQLPRSSYEYGVGTMDFIALIERNLGAVESIVDYLDPLLGLKIAFMEFRRQKFWKLLYVLHFRNHRSVRTVELIYHVQSWASHVSHFVFLYRSDLLTSEYLATTPENDLSNLMWNSMYPRLIELSLDVFKAKKYHVCRATMYPQILPDYVDFLLKHVAISDLHEGKIVRDDLEPVREALMFLLSFSMDSSNEELNVSELILAEINTIICEVPSIMCIPQTDKLGRLLDMIDGVKAKIRELYVVTPISSQFNSPRTNAIGFLDSLLETLQKMLQGGVDLIPLVKNRVMEVHEELAALRPFLLEYDDFELQNEEDKRRKDIHTRIVNVIHFATYVTKLCASTSLSIWYGIMFLPDIIHHIKLVNNEVKKIQDDGKYFNKSLGTEMESRETLPPQATTLMQGEAFIGFREDAESILDHLQLGPKDLTIISISGMSGQGKTTLARKIYDDPSIRHHFHKSAWCSVSKQCKMKRLLSNLLRDGKEGNDFGNLEIHDLSDRVRKNLKGKRYLIVLDDIWDVEVWWQLQYSFPDDKEGSRILFTTRNDNLASQCNPKSISHPLQLFSDEESWELLKDKLAGYVGFSQELMEVGKQIADYCKGLPLAVVVIASYLKRTRYELDLWKEVAENLKSHLASEGCMHILELSYKYLPQHLKPCFLYFGAAFQRGENIHAGKLIRLWIAEGFIKRNETRSSEDLAREYLDYLVSQNLVHVVRRNSMRNINLCTVHDLLYDLCIQKSLEDNFLHLADYRTLQSESHHSQRPWLCIRGMDSAFSHTHLTSHSLQRKFLPSSQVQSLFWSHPDDLPIQSKSLSSFFSNFRGLTVLDMLDVNLEASAFSKLMLLASNIHLRYLGLRGSLACVFWSIENLSNLETLILISDRSVLRIPRSLWEIKSLSYVDMERSCLDFDGYGQNVSTANASNIETLKGILLRCDFKTLEVLRSLPKLRDLKCYSEKCSPEFFCMFQSLEKLERLRILSLKEADLKAFLFPYISFHLPENLKKLSLLGTGLPWKAMSMIGRLPHLEVLKLVGYAFKGATWELEDEEFPKLKHLRLCGLNVRRIDDSDCCDSPFPCLEKLDILGCEKLEEIPASFGEICTLSEINLASSLNRKATAKVQRWVAKPDAEAQSSSWSATEGTSRVTEEAVADRLNTLSIAETSGGPSASARVPQVGIVAHHNPVPRQTVSWKPRVIWNGKLQRCYSIARMANDEVASRQSKDVDLKWEGLNVSSVRAYYGDCGGYITAKASNSQISSWLPPVSWKVKLKGDLDEKLNMQSNFSLGSSCILLSSNAFKCDFHSCYVE